MPVNESMNSTIAIGLGTLVILLEALAFLYPCMLHKSKWSYRQDVQHWSGKPQRPTAYLLAGLAYDRQKYLNVWLA